MNSILVIKLGALGDFIQALGPMAAIRRHHPKAHITLLTTQPYAELAKKSGYFDLVLIDEKPGLFDVKAWFNLKHILNKGGYERVYDLQNNDRTSFYLKLFVRHKKPEWVGSAKGASHRNHSPERTAGHAFDGHAQTLALAGITDVEIDRLSWIQADIKQFSLQTPFVLLIPGSSPEHKQKRWPAESYTELAHAFNEQNYHVVVLGGAHEKDIAKAITDHVRNALDLCGQTSLEQIVTLARQASAAIGNDTGPMHIIAATGCPSLVLFSGKGNPRKHGPKGQNAFVLQKQNLLDIKVDNIMEWFCQQAQVSETRKNL